MGWTGDATPKFRSGLSPTLRASQGGEGAGFLTARHAAPFSAREWERLQGFPDDYTAVTFRDRPASDKQRTTALGNSFPVPVLHWLGQRIGHVHSLEVNS